MTADTQHPQDLIDDIRETLNHIRSNELKPGNVVRAQTPLATCLADMTRIGRKLDALERAAHPDPAPEPVGDGDGVYDAIMARMPETDDLVLDAIRHAHHAADLAEQQVQRLAQRPGAGVSVPELPDWVDTVEIAQVLDETWEATLMQHFPLGQLTRCVATHGHDTGRTALVATIAAAVAQAGGER